MRKGLLIMIALVLPMVASAHDIEVVNYTLDGKRSATPQRGLNILRMSDGSARKVLAQ